MSKKMLINATLSGEERVAIVEDGLLTELDIEVAGSENTKGNIYKAEVIRIEPGLQAAFVNYGAQRHGFLQIGDIHPDLWPKKDGNGAQRPPINEILRRGQQILVQVVKEERGTKGAAVTTEISLAGRYMVLMANSRSRGISRKIDKDSTRKKIKEALKELDLPEEMGYIIRTAAIDQSPEELKRDFNYLFNIYQNIISQAEKAPAPALVYQESSLVLRSVRDYFTPDMDEVLIDDKEIFKQTRDFFKTVMPDHVKLVKLHQERRPIFARYQIEEQIAQLASNSVNLPSGGSIVLDQTEALVAIDVNSGKVSSEQSIESTACLVNVEAATEIARQLRLRDLGGLVVIDFIDMRQRKNARKVEKTLEQALKQDKARITQGRISSLFGLLEMSRQRIKPNLGASSYNSCPHCSGSGRIRSCESRAISLLRRIQAGTAKGKIDRVVANVALDVGVLLLNQKRTELKELEQQQNIEIWIKPQPDHLPDQVDIDFIKDSGEHDDTNGEQKALVDMDYSERSYDIDSDEDKSKGSDDAKDKQDKESAAPQGGQDKDSEQQDDRKDGSKETNGDKPRRPRRSRSSRQRRARADTKGNEDANKETSANSSANDSDVEQKPQVEEEKFASSGTADVQTSPPQAQSKDQESGSAPARPKSSSGRTRRRKPQSSSDSAKAQQSSAQNNEQSTSSQAQENSGSEDKSAQDTETEQPKAKRAPARRRPSSKKTENNGGAESATDSNSTEVSAEEQPKTQRKRTPSRRSTPVKSAKKSASVTEATSVPEESPAPPKQAGEESGKAAQDEGNKTPAPRKRTPRKRTTSKDTATVVASESDSKDSGTKADTSAPDERKNRDINEPVIKQGENAQESEAKKPAPARKRRTSTKKVSAEGGEDTSTASEEKTPAKKTSRRRASTTRRKSAESTTSTQAPDNEVRQSTGAAEPLAEKEVAENAKPAPKRTTRRTAPRRSKSTSTPEEKTSTDSGSEGESKSEATLQRRRTPARRKTTPKPEDEA